MCVTNQQVLIAMEKFEGKMAELYRWYSELYAEDAEASALFYKMSVDEKSHLNVVRYEKRLILQNPALFGAIKVDRRAVQEDTAKVEALLGARRRLALEEAVRLAMDLENGSAERCYRVALQETNPEVAKLLNGMGAGDRQHHEALKEFAKKRGLVPSWTLA